MDDELVKRAGEIWKERAWGDGRVGPVYGAELRCMGYDDWAPRFVAESLRSLVETIAVLEARIERLEKQQ